MYKAIHLHTAQESVTSFLYLKFMGEGTKGQRGRITRSKLSKDLAGLRFEPGHCALARTGETDTAVLTAIQEGLKRAGEEHVRRQRGGSGDR